MKLYQFAWQPTPKILEEKIFRSLCIYPGTLSADWTSRVAEQNLSSNSGRREITSQRALVFRVGENRVSQDKEEVS
jgi:hypothetical protein